MPRKPITMRMDEDLLARIDALAGPGGRTAFFEDALKLAMGHPDMQRESAPVGRFASRSLAAPVREVMRGQGKVRAVRPVGPGRGVPIESTRGAKSGVKPIPKAGKK